jgi:TPR repeat protein
MNNVVVEPLPPAEHLYRAADAADDAGDYATAFRLFTEGAALGDGAAMSRLAILCELGRGTPVDLDASIAWDLKAIDSGHLSSLFNLAVTYRRHGHIRKRATGSSVRSPPAMPRRRSSWPSC